MFIFIITTVTRVNKANVNIDKNRYKLILVIFSYKGSCATNISLKNLLSFLLAILGEVLNLLMSLKSQEHCIKL